jgi:hypothetical protein
MRNLDFCHIRLLSDHYNILVWIFALFSNNSPKYNLHICWANNDGGDLVVNCFACALRVNDVADLLLICFACAFVEENGNFCAFLRLAIYVLGAYVIYSKKCIF